MYCLLPISRLCDVPAISEQQYMRSTHTQLFRKDINRNEDE